MMKQELEKIYSQQKKQKKQLSSLKNKYISIIYYDCLKKKPIHRIHKDLYDATINTKKVEPDKFLLGMMIKFSNRARKLSAESEGLLAVLLFDFIRSSEINKKARKLINHNQMEKSEKQKRAVISDYIEDNRENDKWFYLASSHNDCAEDHKDYQGKMYIDNQAPLYIRQYAMEHDIRTIQWVMDSPVWFITRPNCRHYFVSLTYKEATKKSLKKLKKKYKTHNKEGDRDFSTPAKIAVEEYEDRLKLLKSLYSQFPIEKIKNEILKTELLLKKWKNQL